MRSQIKAAYSTFYFRSALCDSGVDNGNNNYAPSPYANPSHNRHHTALETKTFLAKIRAALIILDDQISSLDEGRATAYETFIMAYKDAFADIWPKINSADATILLQSVKDSELQELRCLSQILCPDKTKPTLVQEKRNVPTLDNILGSLVSRIPEQKLPDKETCSLISTIFLDLAEAHKHYANAAKGIADITGLISPEQLTLILAAAVPPTLQLVLLPGQILPLSTPPHHLPKHRLWLQVDKS